MLVTVTRQEGPRHLKGDFSPESRRCYCIDHGAILAWEAKLVVEADLIAIGPQPGLSIFARHFALHYIYTRPGYCYWELWVTDEIFPCPGWDAAGKSTIEDVHAWNYARDLKCKKAQYIGRTPHGGTGCVLKSWTSSLFRLCFAHDANTGAAVPYQASPHAVGSHAIILSTLRFTEVNTNGGIGQSNPNFRLQFVEPEGEAGKWYYAAKVDHCQYIPWSKIIFNKQYNPEPIDPDDPFPPIFGPVTPSGGSGWDW